MGRKESIKTTVGELIAALSDEAAAIGVKPGCVPYLVSLALLDLRVKAGRSETAEIVSTLPHGARS